MEQTNTHLTEKDKKRNYIFYCIDAALFQLGNAFFEPNSVIPSFIGSFTQNSILIGLSSTIRNLGWFLPQLFVSNYIQDKTYKKPFSLTVSFIMRASALFMALVAMFFGRKSATVTLLLFYFFYSLFSICDGLSGVPWVDILGKIIPERKRGRFIASYQSIGGLLAFAAGFFIKKILESPKLNFPINFSILYILGFIALLISLGFFSLIKEPPSITKNDKMNIKEFFQYVKNIASDDRNLVKAIITNILIRGFFLSMPFYALFANDFLMLSQDVIGYFVSAQMVGYILSCNLWGYLSDHKSNKTVITLTGISAASTPCLALISAACFKTGMNNMLLPIYLVLYATIGFTLSGVFLGFNNYILEFSHEENRAVYIGMCNTLVAPTTLFPILGGLLIQHFSYKPLFIFTTIMILIGVVFSQSLDDRV
ncbi:MAG TPA: MFS transporter [Thermoanaerobacterales bacterium]|nr:MFS transporter [Thermoanaerobacterales bacterium]